MSYGMKVHQAALVTLAENASTTAALTRHRHDSRQAGAVNWPCMGDQRIVRRSSRGLRGQPQCATSSARIHDRRPGRVDEQHDPGLPQED